MSLSRKINEIMRERRSELSEASRDVVPALTALIGRMKALYWFHWTAHWTTAGPPYYGDHEMFARLKDETIGHVDSLAERIVGYYGPEGVDPMLIAGAEREAMAPRTGTLVERALNLERDFQAALQSTYDLMKSSGELSLGWDAFLQEVAQCHDSHLYLLQQRSGGK